MVYWRLKNETCMDSSSGGVFFESEDLAVQHLMELSDLSNQSKNERILKAIQKVFNADSFCETYSLTEVYDEHHHCYGSWQEFYVIRKPATSCIVDGATGEVIYSAIYE